MNKPYMLWVAHFLKVTASLHGVTVLCLVLVLFSFLPSTWLVRGDVYAGYNYLDVQGAKIVSEGGYFWFMLTNKVDKEIEVKMLVPQEFFAIHERTLILSPKASIQPFTFVAPTISSSYQIFRFYFIVLRVGNVESQWEINEYPVFVVDVTTVQATLEKYKGYTFAELWEKYVSLNEQQDRFEDLMRKIEYQETLLKSIEQELAFMQILLSMIFVTIALTISLTWAWTHSKKKEALSNEN